MATHETAYEMVLRHISEQVNRIEGQETLIAKLEAKGQSTDRAQAFLSEMYSLLNLMEDHLRIMTPWLSSYDGRRHWRARELTHRND